MYKFPQIDVADLLGNTSLCTISPEVIWERLVTPQVKALLGDIEYSKVTVRETVAGDFPGDEVTNLNQHRIYGTDLDRVRLPYLNAFFKTTYGAFVVKYEGLKWKAFGWYGDLRNPQLIFKCALRDRRYDGTRRANDNSLIDFAGCYDDPVNAPLSLPNIFPDAKCAEASVYGFMPGSRLADATGDAEYDRFVENPFRFINQPEVFLKHFQMAWKSTRAPGQNGNPIPDVSRTIIPDIDKLALAAGYDYVENASSHYHVARWTESQGYKYATPELVELMNQFAQGLKRIKASGIKLTRQQESWVCVLQSLPAEHIPAGLMLNGPKWPQDNIGAVNLWMYKPISARAIALDKANAEAKAAADKMAAEAKAEAAKPAVAAVVFEATPVPFPAVVPAGSTPDASALVAPAPSQPAPADKKS